MSPCFPLKVLHINATMVGVLFAVLSLFYLLATIIAGKMADKTVSGTSRRHTSTIRYLDR